MSLSEAISNPAPSAAFRPSMPSRTKSVNTEFSRAGDEALWHLHDLFVLEYAALLALDTPEMQEGTRAGATAKQKRAFKAWEKQLNVCDAACCAVFLAPANTIHGMLMKIHIAGFRLECWALVQRTLSRQGCSYGQPASLDASPRIFMDNNEANLIVSIRSDLHALRATSQQDA